MGGFITDARPGGNMRIPDAFPAVSLTFLMLSQSASSWRRPSDHGYSTRGREPLFVRDTRYPGGLHQPQRSLCGVGHARIIRCSFTITLYKPVKVDFHPVNSYLYPALSTL